MKSEVAASEYAAIAVGLVDVEVRPGERGAREPADLVDRLAAKRRGRARRGRASAARPGVATPCSARATISSRSPGSLVPAADRDRDPRRAQRLRELVVRLPGLLERLEPAGEDLGRLRACSRRRAPSRSRARPSARSRGASIASSASLARAHRIALLRLRLGDRELGRAGRPRSAAGDEPRRPPRAGSGAAAAGRPAPCWPAPPPSRKAGPAQSPAAPCASTSCEATCSGSAPPSRRSSAARACARARCADGTFVVDRLADERVDEAERRARLEDRDAGERVGGRGGLRRRRSRRARRPDPAAASPPSTATAAASSGAGSASDAEPRRAPRRTPSGRGLPRRARRPRATAATKSRT